MIQVFDSTFSLSALCSNVPLVLYFILHAMSVIQYSLLSLSNSSYGCQCIIIVIIIIIFNNINNYNNNNNYYYFYYYTM